MPKGRAKKAQPAAEAGAGTAPAVPIGPARVLTAAEERALALRRDPRFKAWLASSRAKTHSFDRLQQELLGIRRQDRPYRDG